MTEEEHLARESEESHRWYLDHVSKDAQENDRIDAERRSERNDTISRD